MVKNIGRRKTAIAQIYKMSGGKNEIFINNVTYTQYFQQNAFRIEALLKPFEILGISERPSFYLKVSGGGLTGQAEACCLAIARILQMEKKSYRQLLKNKGVLKQDARQKERRKYGLKKARKAPQFSKR